jgi:hypothetical protein
MIPEDKVSSLDIGIFEARHPSVEFRMTEGQGFPPFIRLQLRPARHAAKACRFFDVLAPRINSGVRVWDVKHGACANITAAKAPAGK